MPELNPCPFHGEPSTLNVTHSWSRYQLKLGWVFVECSYCGGRGPSIRLNRGMTESEREEAGQRAAVAWNRRESPDTERLDWFETQIKHQPRERAVDVIVDLHRNLRGGLRAALDAARKGE